MTRHHSVRSYLGAALILAIVAAIGAASQSLLSIEKATITIAGTSNVHDYTATTADAKITKVQFGSHVAGATFWDEVQKPGGLTAFDLVIKADSLKSSKDGLDKNMYKALKTKEHPMITFSLKRMEDAPGALRAIGVLQIAALLRGTLSRAEALDRAQAATRQYAKRQFTWLRHQPPAGWPRHEVSLSVDSIKEIAIKLQHALLTG